MSDFYSVRANRLEISPGLPVGMIPITHARGDFSKVSASAMCANFRAWEGVGLSPGPIQAHCVYVDMSGNLAFHYSHGGSPRALMANTGLAPDVAAWLVLLDKIAPTDDVVAQSRSVWSASELAQALPFVTPAFLPAGLVAWPPKNWERVARALARVAAGDGSTTR